MAMYLKNFVTGHNIKFETNKRNLAALEKATDLWTDIWRTHEPDEQSVILVAGAKNNGKSSLLRFLINTYNDTHSSRRSSTSKRQNGSNQDKDSHESDGTASDMEMIDENEGSESGSKLEDHDVYAYLVDCDPGQSELTTPGMISAHIIRATAVPLQSPSYLNIAQHEPLIMSSVGGMNMSVNPRMYIQNARFVYNKVIEHRNNQDVKRPLFINTMGHIRNVGLAMLMDLIKICQPTSLIVLNVESDPMRVIYADLSPKAMDNARASFFYETNQQRQKRLDYNYDLQNLQFAFVDSSSIANKNRTAAQLAYMATIPEAIYKPIMQLNSKWLSFTRVAVHCVSSYPLKEVIVLELLQHSWVHLVRLRRPHVQAMASGSDSNSEPGSDTTSQPTSENSICKILEDVSENTLFGCGIVADMDLDQKRIAVITPLDQETLDTCVDCIIKPLSIQVPQQMLQEGFCN